MIRARSLTLHQLEIFAAVAHEGSFTRAAHALLLSEPAVSQQIKLLEIAVGVRLFLRLPRQPIRLTDAGRRLLASCDKLFENLDETLEQLKALGRGQQDSVTLGAGPYFGSYLLPSLYAGFHQHSPQIRVKLDIFHRTNFVESLRRREIDLAVIFGGIQDPFLIAEPLAGNDHVWVAPPGHPLTKRQSVPLRALAAECLILPVPSSATRRVLDRRAAKYGVMLTPSLELGGTVEANLTSVGNGLGIALVPYHAAAERQASGELEVLDVEGFPMRLEWFLISRAEGLPPAASAFKEYLLAHRHQLSGTTVVRTVS